MLRIYGKRIVTTANTAKQSVFSKQWAVPVTIRAMRVETSDTSDLTVRGRLDGIEWLADSLPATLEQVDWIPLNMSPRALMGKLEVEVDNSHASNTPDISVNFLVDLGANAGDNLPWIKGGYVSGSSTTQINKVFDRDAQLAWVYFDFTGGTAKLRVAGNTIMGDDEGFNDEPRTPPQGLVYPQFIPATAVFDLALNSATGHYIVVVNKPR